MIKNIITGICFFFLVHAASACVNALPTNDVNFCTSFRTAATCYCTISGVPAGLCQDMNMIYSRMMSTFQTLERACKYQKFTDPQDCIDNWNCYRVGGIDSRGRICSSTYRACQ